jgi:hypothetical protein
MEKADAYRRFLSVCYRTPDLGRAMINVCMNAWVGKIRGLSDEVTFSLIMAGLKKIVSPPDVLQ